MLKKIENTMQKHDMAKLKSVLVGLSGGADSVVLTHALCRLSEKYGFKVYAAHVNHCLRGDNAVRDEDFSRQFAHGLGIEFFSLKADVKSIAKEQGISEELAGREVRYEYFKRLCAEYNIDCVATAHHKNDNAETIMMNFMRGSGLKGICGIPYKRDNIIRPLLDCSRSEIEEYCKEHNLVYVTDETNLEEEYTRNKIRHSLIPMIEERFNPSIVDTLSRNAEIISLEDDFISSQADAAYGSIVNDNTLDISEARKLHKAVVLRVIRKMTDRICTNTDVSQSTIMAVYELVQNNKTGTKVEIIRDTEACVRYGKLIIEKKHGACKPFSYELIPGKMLVIPELGCTVLAEWADEFKKDGAAYFSVPEHCSMVIRNRREGDMFRPTGMTGSKKIKQFMIDKKIPQHKRDSIGILTVNDEIAWVMGYRQSESFKFNGKGIKITVNLI